MVKNNITELKSAKARTDKAAGFVGGSVCFSFFDNLLKVNDRADC